MGFQRLPSGQHPKADTEDPAGRACNAATQELPPPAPPQQRQNLLTT